MGLLDDAIREHLDLKRRRGADPVQIERDEREALGPVRRSRESGGATVAADLPESSPAERWVDTAAGPPTDEADRAYAEERTRVIAPSDADEPLPPPRSGTVVDGGDVDDVGEADEPFTDRPSRAVRPPPGSDAGGETRAFSLEEALAAEDAASAPEAGEDVLEETPEFLQDTPDHDRLWFEQRPPRDFDFDG